MDHTTLVLSEHLHVYAQGLAEAPHEIPEEDLLYLREAALELLGAIMMDRATRPEIDTAGDSQAGADAADGDDAYCERYPCPQFPDRIHAISECGMPQLDEPHPDQTA